MTDIRARPGTTVWRCPALLTRTGWRRDAAIVVDSDGIIVRVGNALNEVDRDGRAKDAGGWVIPGFYNAHSHAFQYAMAGLAEHLPKGAAQDDFWSWRDAMYRLALAITPEQMEAVATMAYAEMARNGYTAVAEFHYLHRDVTGAAYANEGEMAARLAAAAKTAGVMLTLIPVFYQRGGFSTPAAAAQKRFLSATRDDYWRLLAATKAAVGGDGGGVVVGAGVHSLRAVTAEDAIAVLGNEGKDSGGPLHVHIAEQRKEVDECVAAYGMRPVEWLLKHVDLKPWHHLVHATHMADGETDRLAQSGAVAVVCPSTEGNLGDGFFALSRYRAAGGTVAIGSDSHIGLSPIEELRWLDYGQRMRAEKRNGSFAAAGIDPEQDSGVALVRAAWDGGRCAMGMEEGGEYFQAGDPFDAVVIDSEHPLFSGKPEERRMSCLVYGGDASCLKATIRKGQRVVEDGRHAARDRIRKEYARAIAELLR